MNNNFLKSLGKTIQAKRHHLGYSQQEFADLTGFHRSYIADVERGARNISILNLLRIGDGLGCFINQLISIAELKRSLDI